MVPAKETIATRMQIVTEHSLRDAGIACAKLVGKETGEAVLVILVTFIDFFFFDYDSVSGTFCSSYFVALPYLSLW